LFGDRRPAGRWRCDGGRFFEFHADREQCREWGESYACEAQWKEATHTPLACISSAYTILTYLIDSGLDTAGPEFWQVMRKVVI